MKKNVLRPEEQTCPKCGEKIKYNTKKLQKCPKCKNLIVKPTY